jgi:hypothetical protein
MPDARYLRAQAQHYLNFAQRNSKSWEATTLRMMAAECISDAERLEAGNTSNGTRTPRAGRRAHAGKEDGQRMKLRLC